MFLQVLTNTRQVNFEWHVDFGEDLRTPDAGEFKKLGTSQRSKSRMGSLSAKMTVLSHEESIPSTQDDLLVCRKSIRFPTGATLELYRAYSGNDRQARRLKQLSDLGVHDYIKVTP